MLSFSKREDSDDSAKAALLATFLSTFLAGLAALASGFFSSSAAVICTTILVGSSSFALIGTRAALSSTLYSGERSGAPFVFLPSVDFFAFVF